MVKDNFEIQYFGSMLTTNYVYGYMYIICVQSQ